MFLVLGGPHADMASISVDDHDYRISRRTTAGRRLSAYCLQDEEATLY